MEMGNAFLGFRLQPWRRHHSDRQKQHHRRQNPCTHVFQPQVFILPEGAGLGVPTGVRLSSRSGGRIRPPAHAGPKVRPRQKSLAVPASPDECVRAYDFLVYPSFSKNKQIVSIPR